MRSRLILILVVLVLLPAAILSVMSARALRNRELILQLDLETAAVGLVRALSDQLIARMDIDKEKTVAAFNDALSQGGRQSELKLAADRARQASFLAGQAYLYADPWGFAFPPQKDPVPAETASIVNVLKRELAVLGGRPEAVRFTVDKRYFCFAPVQGRKGLYAGFEIDPVKLSSQVTEYAAKASRGGFFLHTDLPGAPLPEGAKVTDSLSSTTAGRPVARGSLVASGRLVEPFDDIRVKVAARDFDASAATRRIQMRLYGWGIALMAIAVIAGVVLAMGESARAIRRAAARSDYVVGMSHDLRTPLASMKMLAESMLMGSVTDEDQKKRFLETLVREADRLNQLVERALFFVRFGQDALVFTPRVMDAGAAALEVAKTVCERHPLEASGDALPGTEDGRGVRRFSCRAARIEVRAGGARAIADPEAIEQVLLNLVDNAMKYGARGGRAEVSVTVDACRARRAWYERPRRWVRIEVSDRGEGLRRGELRKVFRPFYRGQAAREANLSGVGLGLALCRKIVRAHGGWMEVRSAPGAGATFTVWLAEGEG